MSGYQLSNVGLPAQGAVGGVDVGYSVNRRSSAVCRLEWDADTVRLEAATFRYVEHERLAILGRILGGRTLEAIALDGPLRRGLDTIDAYRKAEQYLTRGLAAKIGKPGTSNSPGGRDLNAAANTLAREALQAATVAPARHAHAIHDRAIAEAFPSSFLGLMLPDPAAVAVKRSNRSDHYYKALVAEERLQALIERLLPGRRIETDLMAVRNHDERAAVVCALTALCLAAGDYSCVGDENGWVILPPRDFIEPLAWAILQENAGTAGLAWTSQKGSG